MAATAPPSSAGFSVLVLTRNEQVNIGECLRAFSFCDDVVVLDSCSTDRTVEIAQSYPNVRIVQRPFDTEYIQRNYGLHEIAYKYPWVYICDADERVSTELVREIQQKIQDPSLGHSAYRLRYKNMFRGRWIRHASGYPVWIIRLVQPQRVKYEVRETNVHPLVDGTVGELENHFIHYSFNAGLRHWFAKHNFYSTREAAEGLKVRQASKPRWRELQHADPMVRRRALKDLSYFLLGRELWRFAYMFIARGGILDGRAGFHYCRMISMYEHWIELKMREHETNWRMQTDDLVHKLLAEKES